MKLALLFGAALLAAGTALHAQTGDKPAKKRPPAAELAARAEKTCEAARKRIEKSDFSRAQATYRECMQRELCARRKDKAACSERVAKRFEAEDRSRRACARSKGKEPAYGDCMRRERCVGTPDPVRCEERARTREICQVLAAGSQAHQDCVRRETCKQRDNPARCEANARAREACKGRTGDAQRACLQEQRGKKA